MKYAIIDTETTGMFDFKLPADDPSQPRLAQFAGIAVELNEARDGFDEVERIQHYIKPEGWVMEGEAAAVNGLTTEILAEKGIPIGGVLNQYNSLIDDGFIMVAYNAQFDLKMMRAEFRRAERDDRFKETPNICVMRAAKKALEIPGRGFAKLSRVCEILKIENAKEHDAMGDAQAAFEVFVALHGMNALPEPQVYFAKEKAAHSV